MSVSALYLRCNDAGKWQAPLHRLYLPPTLRVFHLKLTAELSLYPLRDAYIDAITAFIDAARLHDGLTIITNAMSTQICGDYDQVMDLISSELKASYERVGRQVLVCKLIPGELDLQ
jgi:uncharacterized protein YqgV (UPF0045/DUF77 family)